MNKSDEPEKSDENGQKYLYRYFLTGNGYNWTTWSIVETPDKYEKSELARSTGMLPTRDGKAILVRAELHFTRYDAYRWIYDDIKLVTILGSKWDIHYLPDPYEKVVMSD